MEDIIKIKNEQGEEKSFDILLTFTKDEKNIIVFTDHQKDEQGNIKCYTKEEKDNQLFDVTDNATLIAVDELLKTITTITKEKYQKLEKGTNN